MDKLKYCPFCGGKAKMGSYEGTLRTEFYATCTECNCSTMMFGKEEEAAEKWNSRFKAPVRIMRRGRKA